MLEDIKKIIELCLSNNVKRIKLESVEIEFHDKLVPMAQNALVQSDLGIETERMPTEDELLYLSSGYMPEVEATPPK